MIPRPKKLWREKDVIVPPLLLLIRPTLLTISKTWAGPTARLESGGMVLKLAITSLSSLLNPSNWTITSGAATADRAEATALRTRRLATSRRTRRADLWSIIAGPPRRRRTAVARDSGTARQRLSIDEAPRDSGRGRA